MRILVTGSNGFLATQLVRLLLDEKEEVLGADLGHSAAECRSVVCDFSTFDAVRSLLKTFAPERIYNLAGTFSDDYHVDWTSNYLVAQNILFAVSDLGLESRVLLVGSAAEYGRLDPKDNPVPEEHPLHPASIYGLTKAMQTLLASYCASTLGMDVVVARLFNLIGKGISERLFVGRVYSQIDAVLSGRAEKIHVGRLAARRDFLHVSSAARLIKLVMEKGERGEVYNIGSGSSRALDEVLQSILAEHGLGMDIVVQDSGNRIHQSDPDDIYADIRKLTRLQRGSP